MQNSRNMGFNRFYLSIAVNGILILAFSFLCFYFYYTRQQPTTAIGMAIISFLLAGRLVYFVNRTNRILGNFLMFMQDQDPSLSYSVKFTDRNFRGLNESLGRIINEYKESRIELEVQAQYLGALLGNVSTGIIGFNDAGEITTMNRAAGDLLGAGKLQHIRELDNSFPGMGTRMADMLPHEQGTEKIHSAGGEATLSVHCARMKLKGDLIRIISINDISSQMEEQEIESWKKLIRVINHEIMNSMTPIITLTAAIRKKLMKGPGNLEDAVQSAALIEERSRGLINFIDRYRKLTGLPPPRKGTIEVAGLLASMEKFFRQEFADRGISFQYPPGCEYILEADREMLEQVLINLISNSIEAVREVEAPVISLDCRRDEDGRVNLLVKDNGKGIPEDKLEKVFIPFFTTREKGSGIGLSLCRQIMRLHNGTIAIDSKPGKGTEVELKFSS